MKASALEWFPAKVLLLRELKALGYPGGISVPAHLATLWSVAKPEHLMRFETEPRRPMLADFTTIGRSSGRLELFIATLGWSREATSSSSPMSG